MSFLRKHVNSKSISFSVMTDTLYFSVSLINGLIGLCMFCSFNKIIASDFHAAPAHDNKKIENGNKDSKTGRSKGGFQGNVKNQVGPIGKISTGSKGGSSGSSKDESPLRSAVGLSLTNIQMATATEVELSCVHMV